MTELPLLYYFSRKEESEKPLKNFVVLLVQHLLQDSKAFISALERAGAEKDRLIIVGIPYSSKDNIISELRENNYKVHSPESYPFDDYVKRALSEAFRLCNEKGYHLIVIEDSKRVEIDVEELKRLCLNEKRTKIGTWYELANGNKILLLADGFPVNFFSSESVPDKAIDPILTLMFLGAVKLAKEDLEPKIHKCPIDENDIASLFREIHFTLSR